MGKHREPRRAPVRSPLQALQNAALPAALLIVVGVIAFASPVLRDGGPESAVDGTFTSAESTPAAPAPSDEESRATGRRRAGSDLVFKAEIVQATHLERKPKPQIPADYVRVQRDALLATQFTVSSYNVLGFGHTAPGGNKKGWADGRTRMRWATDQLRGHDVSVVGFQEFQLEQAATFNAVAGDYAVYPGSGGGRQGVQNSIAWRRADWTVVEASTIGIPYFGGSPMPMPYVLLRNLHTGQHVWFANFHNPADARGPAERHRDAATSIEISLFNRLRADTGYPVVVTGDMNEREEYLCRVATSAAMHSADGGYADGSGCHYSPPMQVDWIFGTPELDFSGYLADRGPYVSRTSDHPLVVADAAIEPVHVADRCVQRKATDPFVFCPPA